MKSAQTPLVNIEGDIDRAWKETHLAARHFVRAGSDDAARRYDIAFSRFQKLIKQRMVIRWNQTAQYWRYQDYTTGRI